MSSDHDTQAKVRDFIELLQGLGNAPRQRDFLGDLEAASKQAFYHSRPSNIESWQDLRQIVFLKFWESLETYQGDKSLKAVFYRIATNALEDADRRRSRRVKTLSQSWAGALREYRNSYSSLELQKKSLEWRGD